ncbi:MAG: 4Fe-4S dicluster domain-containing protein [Anaerolineae bacterium]|nr:4Fe-4S dicluster domain-containing protein [Anaerolineae bacterium]
MKRNDAFGTRELPEELQESLQDVYVDDLLVTLKYFVDENQPHLWIEDQDICARCQHKPCLYFCPVNVYSLAYDGTIQVSYQACVECGSCRVACPYTNIGWVLPRGGYGVAYKFG